MNKQVNNYLAIFEKLDFEKIIYHPNILIAANFWDEERFCAAKTCYRFMRFIDDLIDNYKSENQKITDIQKDFFEKEVKNWISSIKDNETTDPIKKTLNETMSRFKIPFWTMEAFARSMIFDINHDGFDTLDTFLEYCGGASVAPAAVFVHLCAVSFDGSEYNVPAFDVRKAATPCALFSYIVHIIRDFQKDQHNNLTYFADDLIFKNGLDRSKLKTISYGGEITPGFRQMIRTYYNLADQYRAETFQMIEEIKPLLAPCYQLSLEIIFDLYLMVFERIDPDCGLFTAEELNPTPKEIKERVHKVILEFKPVDLKGEMQKGKLEIGK